MTMTRLNENTRTYATEANLIKGLDSFGLARFKPLIVNHGNRFTAVFSWATMQAMGECYVGRASCVGFMTI